MRKILIILKDCKKVEYRHFESIQQFPEIHVDFCNYKWF